MKFFNGNWLMQENVSPLFAQEAMEIAKLTDTKGKAQLRVYCPFRPTPSRAASIDGGLLTVTYTAPMSDVIGVRLTHFAGVANQRPAFELFEEDHAPVISIQEDAATMQSGDLCVRIDKEGAQKVEFLANGRLLTDSLSRSQAVYVVDGKTTYISEQLGLNVGTQVYGLGERFTPFVKNGQVVDIWNEDGGTSSEQSYKNIPFYLTNQGYGVFVNHPGKVSFEVGSEKVTKVQFSVPGQEMEYFVIYGKTPKDILSKYTALTGRPALPPAWSFGLWLSTSFTTQYDEKTVMSFIDGMQQREIPMRVFHFDCFWMREFQWCDFTWDTRVFPDPVGMLARLHEKNLKVCVWINPYIAQKSPLFEEAMHKGYLLTHANGDVWQWNRWQAGMGLVDFTHPEARAWFQSKLKTLLNMGVDCFKTDFGERIPTDCVYHDGADPLRMHNYYTQMFNKCVFDLLVREKGEGEAVLFARSATVGGQQFPVHWGGDCTGVFASMAESLRGGLSLMLSGFGFWSHDMGGFESSSTPDVYKRWAAFGLLSSHSRLHGSTSYRVPWVYDEEASDVVRHFSQLKCSIMPYLFGAAVHTHHTGVPTMRAMMLEFDDPACETLDRQYMLGENLLVAPIFSEDGWVSYYVPAGNWTHFTSGEVIVGGSWRKEKHDYFSLPLMARENSIIAVGAHNDVPDYDYADQVTYHVFCIKDEASCVIYDINADKSGSLHVQHKDETLHFEATGDKPFTVLLRGMTVRDAQGATWTKEKLGVLVLPMGSCFTLHL